MRYTFLLFAVFSALTGLVLARQNAEYVPTSMASEIWFLSSGVDSTFSLSLFNQYGPAVIGKLSNDGRVEHSLVRWHSALEMTEVDDRVDVEGLIDATTILVTSFDMFSQVTKLSIVSEDQAKVIDTHVAVSVLSGDKKVVFYAKEVSTNQFELWRYEIDVNVKQLLKSLPGLVIGVFEANRNGSVLMIVRSLAPVEYELVDGNTGNTISTIVPNEVDEYARPLKLHPDSDAVFGVGM